MNLRKTQKGMIRPLTIGARKTLNRVEAIEAIHYLRLRTEDINRLDFLVNALYEDRIPLPTESPFFDERFEGYR